MSTAELPEPQPAARQAKAALIAGATLPSGGQAAHEHAAAFWLGHNSIPRLGELVAFSCSPNKAKFVLKRQWDKYHSYKHTYMYNQQLHAQQERSKAGFATLEIFTLILPACCWFASLTYTHREGTLFTFSFLSGGLALLVLGVFISSWLPSVGSDL